MFRAICAMMVALLIMGCEGMKIEDFKDGTPRFELERYFAGKTKAWGIFHDRFGRVKRQFTVDILGEVDGDTLTLTEDFTYVDGESERRVWTVRRTGPNSYEGTADGVIGVAKGRIAGNAFHWVYDFNLPVGGGTWKVTFDDWMFLQPGGDVVLNRADVSKWGLTLGTATISFAKQPDHSTAANGNVAAGNAVAAAE